MTNEIAEFKAYTECPDYSATGKHDCAFLGRFTFDTIMNFEGFVRILTILARGYMFRSGSNPRNNLEYTRSALCAWCSVPDDNSKNEDDAGWKYKTDFRSLHSNFPELVDENGGGWLYRHVHAVAAFILQNKELVKKSYIGKAEKIQKSYDRELRKRLIQYQIPLYSPKSRGTWVLRFDDILADALEQGALQDRTPTLPAETEDIIKAGTPDNVPEAAVRVLFEYYYAEKADGCDWVVLPVANFNAFFGSTMFDKKWLSVIVTAGLIERKTGHGVSLYRVKT